MKIDEELWDSLTISDLKSLWDFFNNEQFYATDEDDIARYAERMKEIGIEIKRRSDIIFPI